MAFLPALIAAIGAGAAIQSGVQTRKAAKSQKNQLTRERAAADAEEAEAKRKRDTRLRRTRGLGGTLLTGGQGVTESGNVSQKRLLGE